MFGNLAAKLSLIEATDQRESEPRSRRASQDVSCIRSERLNARSLHYQTPSRASRTLQVVLKSLPVDSILPHSNSTEPEGRNPVTHRLTAWAGSLPPTFTTTTPRGKRTIDCSCLILPPFSLSLSLYRSSAGLVGRLRRRR